jgi:hypothetical protein
MISRTMRSPWHEEKAPREEQQDQQILLGQFIERSTSAPPISEQKLGGFMNENESNVSDSYQPIGIPSLFKGRGCEQAARHAFIGTLSTHPSLCLLLLVSLCK